MAIEVRLKPKILLATFGTLGDIHPFIALGNALRRRGLSPLIATSAMHRGLIEGEGIAFAPMRPDESDIARTSGLDIVGVLRRMRRDPHFILDEIYLRFLAETHADIVKAAAGARLVVAHSLLIGANLAAQSCGLPCIRLALAPIHLQSARSPSVTPPLPYIREPRSVAAVRYNAVLREVLRRRLALKLKAVHAFRRAIGLPRSNEDAFLDFGRPNTAQAIVGFYPNRFAPLAADQPRNARLVGFPVHRSSRVEHAALAPDLRAFLDGGDPPIVFTLGSFAVEASGSFPAASIAACRAIGRRALLLTGAREAARVATMTGPSEFVCAYAPHDLVFPRTVCIVHHGGMGTTGAALRSGKPQLVVPFFGDQPDQAARLARLGIARVLRPSRYTAARAAAHLTALLRGPYRSEARDFAATIAEDDGAETLAAQIAETLRPPAAQGLSGSHTTGRSL